MKNFELYIIKWVNFLLINYIILVSIILSKNFSLMELWGQRAIRVYQVGFLLFLVVHLQHLCKFEWC